MAETSDISVTPAKDASKEPPKEDIKAANEVNPLDQKAETVSSQDSSFIQNIVATETSEGEKNILDAPPELDQSLLEDVAPPKSILLLILKVVFAFLVTIGVISVTFFTFQLSDTFEFVSSYFGIETPAKRISSINAEMKTLKDDTNFYNYLQTKANLDLFSYAGDYYIQNYEIATSSTSSDSEIKKAEQAYQSVRSELKEPFVAARNLLTQPFITQLIDLETGGDETQLYQVFEQSLAKEFEKKVAELAKETDAQAKRDYKNYVQTMKLIGNKDLKNLLVATDFDDLTDEELYQLVKNVNGLIVNDLSTIQKIKDQRIKWSNIMKEIEMRTIAVDSEYNDQYYAQLGGIRYTSYDFDADQRRISITGETKLFDTTNFTMISNLIDEFNRSVTFDNAEMRSFSKTGSLDSGYTASLHLSLDLEDQEESKELVDVEEVPDFIIEENLTR